MDLACEAQKQILKAGFKKNSHFLLAVSGGLDSVCLFHIFLEILGPKKISVAHFDHGLREDSNFDAKFVKKLCASKKVSFYSTKARNLFSRAGNLEENARQARYNFLFDVATKVKAQAVVTAHHGDDQLETVLMNFQRGASFEGLSGMDSIKRVNFNGLDGYIFRPFLDTFKEDFLVFVKQRGIVWREDYTNKNLHFKRNYLRHKVLLSVNKQAKKALLKNIDSLRREKESLYLKLDKFVETLTIHKGSKIIVLKPEIKQFKIELLKEAVLFCIRNLNLDMRGFNKKNLATIINGLRKAKGNQEFNLPNGLKILADYDNVAICMGKPVSLTSPTIALKMGKNKINNLNIEVVLSSKHKKKGLNFDYNEIAWPLRVRSFNTGDKFNPTGLKSSKKLQDFFVDEKIPADLRKALPLIVDRNNVIVVVLGIRQADYAIIDKKTKKILNITIEEKHE